MSNPAVIRSTARMQAPKAPPQPEVLSVREIAKPFGAVGANWPGINRSSGTRTRGVQLSTYTVCTDDTCHARAHGCRLKPRISPGIP